MSVASAENGDVAYTPERVVKVRYCGRTEIDIELCYDTFGDSSRPPLVLVMGLNGQMVMWDEDFCRRLARYFYVIRFDNRDVGKSSKVEHKDVPTVYAHVLPAWLQWFKTPEPYTLDCMAADVWALVDVVVGKSAKAHLAGVSMGGMIAQCATLQHPERVLSLTSIMSSTNAPDLPEPPLWVKWELTRKPKSMAPEDRIQFRLDICKKVLAHEATLDEARLLKNTEQIVNRSNYMLGFTRHVAAIQRAPPRDAMLRELGNRAPPTLVIHGAKDVLVPPAAGKRTADVIHGAKLVMVDDMGHIIDASHFDTVVDEMATVAGLK